MKRCLLLISCLAACIYLTSLLFSSESHDAFRYPEHSIPIWLSSRLGPYSVNAAHYNRGLYTPQDRIDQVHVLQRHGARLPTAGALRFIRGSVAKLQSAEEYTDSRLDFLRSYELGLESDTLLQFGRQESYASGAHVYQRYSELVDHCPRLRPFIRASSSPRVVESAYAWTRGFADTAKDFGPQQDILVIDDGRESNDTLANHHCPNLDLSLSTKAMTEWSTYFNPAVDRLNTAALGAQLTVKDIPGLMSLCSFETLAKGKKSSFCDLFEDGEWDAFDYLFDLQKWYFTGPGNPLGRVQGVGWITELLTRLTGHRYIDTDNTQTNKTLNASEDTFPFDACIYADFSHDNQIIPILAALGLFNTFEPLDPLTRDASHLFKTSHLVPFASSFVVERIQIESALHVRLLINDQVVSLAHLCPNEQAGHMCPLDEFVRYAGRYALNEGQGEWPKCFGRQAMTMYDEMVAYESHT